MKYANPYTDIPIPIQKNKFEYVEPKIINATAGTAKIKKK